ncbi:S8 family peptidase [Bacillus velezensis]|uniref:S8 family peptidase n=1 Tax=Bacillus velezensis TaxID=492670 RepID=UPI000C198D25|nr:S8 family serine peptidase [Bacillus velezensis]ATU28559.1 hypothetical protein BMJ37_18055 [Bacillus velezensis]TEW81443.1 hypothetical protein E2496_04780 [Bacillus velezensis]
MKKGIIRYLLPAFVLSFTLSTSSQAAPASKPQTPDLEKAEVFGDIDMTTGKQTTVIVELKEKSLAEAKELGKAQTKSKLKSERSKVKKKALKTIKHGKINREYEQVFSGFSMKLPANEIPKLLSDQDVKAVYPNVTYHTDQLKDKDITLSKDAVSPQMDDSAPYIGANDAWKLGYTGKGVKVAIIDTGVEYKHPDLKKNFGQYKGYDFVDNDYDPEETPSGDPRGASTDHGTHVAGTVAANGTIKGVAPDATLLAYRVLGPGGSGTTENVIAGIERAVQDGADVMNLSLGNSVNNPDWATSTALDWAMSEGVTAVTSNGNSGPNNWTVGSPGTSREAISVGATQLPLNEYAVSFGSYSSAKVMGYNKEDDIKALNKKETELIEAGIGEQKDFEGKDLKGKVAVVKRGSIAFVDKADNAKKVKAGTYEGTVTVREGGKTVAKVPTLLIVKEPDYPRVTSIDVQDGTTQGTYQIETYLPAGAEELAFLVYDSNLDFVGQAGIYKKQDKGYQYFDWNGKVNGDTALPAGEYYMLAYAANKGKSSQVLTEKPFIIE